MTTPTLKLEGAADVLAGLNSLKDATAKAVVRKSLVASLAPVEAAAIASVQRRTGKLANSIGIGTSLTRRQKRLEVPIAPVQAYVGPGVKGGGFKGAAHAHLVEYGTVRMRPRPFMRPAWAANLTRVFASLADLTSANLAKALRRRGN